MCPKADLLCPCQSLSLAGQRRRCPRFCFLKLCDLVTDDAEDRRYCKPDEKRQREQSGDADPDPYPHGHISGIGSPSPSLKRL